MIINVEFTHMKAPPEERHEIERIIKQTFSRVNASIQAIHITVSDLNGPKGGIDKECAVNIESTHGTSVFVKDVQSNVFKAVKLAIERAHYAFIRKQKRTQLLKRRQRKALSLIHSSNELKTHKQPLDNHHHLNDQVDENTQNSEQEKQQSAR